MSDMTKEEIIEFEAQLSSSLKQAIADVITSLGTQNGVNAEDLHSLSQLSTECVEEFCMANALTVKQEFKDAMTTPFSIAKYLTMCVQANSIIDRVDSELRTTLDTSKVLWRMHDDFSNLITFERVFSINSEEKPESLLIKYRLDAEENSIVYAIQSTNWGWEISAQQLKALLEGTPIPNIMKSISQPSGNVDISTSMTSEGCTIDAGNVIIKVVKK